MIPEPWHSDRILTPVLVRTVLREQFRHLSVSTVTYLNEGWDSQAYLVDQAFVFRFPKRQEVQAFLDAELRLLDLLANLPIPIPRPAFRGQPSPHFPYRFMGYALLPGTPGDRCPTETIDLPAAAGGFGRFLSILHTVPRSTLDPLRLRSYAPLPADRLQEARSLAAHIAPHLPPSLLPLCAPYLDASKPLPPPWPYPLALAHYDLQAEHVLISPAGQLAGIIDFGDAGLGDPTADLASLYAWLGPAFLRLLLPYYTAPRDPSFLDRLLFRARCFAPIGIGWAAKANSPTLPICLRFLHNAFTPLD